MTTCLEVPVRGLLLAVLAKSLLFIFGGDLGG